MVRAPFLVFGGTALFEEFFRSVERLTSWRDLWICSPYFDADVQRWLAPVRSMNARGVRLSAVAASERAADAARRGIGSLPWASQFFGFLPELHAKMLLASSHDGSWVCLVGSHNFTEPGALKNFEAGVLLVTNEPGELADVAVSVRDQLIELARRSRAI